MTKRIMALLMAASMAMSCALLVSCGDSTTKAPETNTPTQATSGTPSETPSETPTGTPTVTPGTPTVTPSDTPTVTPSDTPTVTPSDTPNLEKEGLFQALSEESADVILFNTCCIRELAEQKRRSICQGI